jgi:mannose PTS system EIIA component
LGTIHLIYLGLFVYFFCLIDIILHYFYIPFESEWYADTMSVALLLITHDSIGSSLLETATNMLGLCPVAAEVLSITQQCNPEQMYDKAEHICHSIEQGDGLLILTDMFGSTPSNIALRLMQKKNSHSASTEPLPERLDSSRLVVTGVNLSMLVRVMNYPQLCLSELAEKAKSGGIEGVFIVAE